MVQSPARLPTVQPYQENKEVYKSFLSSHAHSYRTLHIQMYDRFYLSAYPAIPSGTYQGQNQSFALLHTILSLSLHVDVLTSNFPYHKSFHINVHIFSYNNQYFCHFCMRVSDSSTSFQDLPKQIYSMCCHQ